MTKEQLLTTTDIFLLDLDGTVYLSGEPIGDMVNTLARLRAMGKKLAFVTNASSKTEAEYERLLGERGLWVEGDYTFTSGTAGLHYLQKYCAGKRVHILGTDAMKNRFAEAGVLLDEQNAEVCLLSYDTEVTFAKLKAFGESLQKGALYIATHNDLVCPTPTYPMPDAGSFIFFFKGATGRMPQYICGKPGTILIEEIEKRTGISRERACMVGDRLYTDIRFANENKIRSICVLSGEATRESIRNSSDTPDLVLKSFNEIFSEE